MMLRKLAALVLLCSGASVSLAAMTVSGEVRNPGPIPLAPEARLLDVITASQPDAQGYWLGAAWLRQPLLAQQARLKAGVLFDLQTCLLYASPSPRDRTRSRMPSSA